MSHHYGCPIISFFVNLKQIFPFNRCNLHGQSQLYFKGHSCKLNVVHLARENAARWFVNSCRVSYTVYQFYHTCDFLLFIYFSNFSQYINICTSCEWYYTQKYQNYLFQYFLHYLNLFKNTTNRVFLLRYATLDWSRETKRNKRHHLILRR